MRKWHELKSDMQQTWIRLGRHKIYVGILFGFCLILGIGIGVYSNRPQREPVSVSHITREEVEEEVQTRVERVIADLYPWIVDGPIQVVTVEPPGEELPQPTNERPEPEPVSIEQLIWPVHGEISTPYGWYRHPTYGDWRFNSGVEFNVTGDAIRTVLPGEVVAVNSNGMDTKLIIDHGSGWCSTYSSIRGIKVSPGEFVAQNQDIALPEKSGAFFFELSYEDEPVNPQAFLR
ncbi:MAG: M23 family metallopeptidase [Bacillota bacterium]|nr:M23 family metallopeptidase [Bacillota bacterium]